MTTHPSPAIITRYADGADLDEATVWSVEVHLESCAPCRDRMSGGDALLERIAAGVDAGIAAGPAPVRHRRVYNRWLVWHLVPWLIMTIAVLACAVMLQAVQPAVPLVSLLAPVAPLPGVALAWSRRHDPLWELVSATPKAGLAMLLRRTAGVLAVIVPVLALASSRTGVSLALTLLPCLAFSAATIMLGAYIGVHRAAVWLGSLWVLAVAVPAIFTVTPPVVLRPGTAGVWALITVILGALAVARAANFRRLSSHN
jgi:putative zinc finger protein